MKRIILIILLSTMLIKIALANCDLTKFDWDCDIPFNMRATHHHPALIYCGNTYGYVTKAQYDEMMRYQRSDVNMVLMLNDGYYDSPCLPNRR